MRLALSGGVWILALTSLALSGAVPACADDAPLVCIDNQQHNPTYDHACKGNLGCTSLSTWVPGKCTCSYCADERCVSVVCSQPYPDSGPDAGFDAANDLKADTIQPDTSKLDAVPGDTAVDAPIPDAVPKDTAMLDAASAAYKDLEWIHSRYTGGFNPHTSTSTLKASALTLQTSSLAGGVIKTCKATLTAQQLATLLVAAGKVTWSAVKPNYMGVGCGYPGDSGQLKITLIPPQGASTTVDTKWCLVGKTPQGVPSDLVAFLTAADKVDAAACP